MTTLDVQYKQVLLKYPADNVPWHHRLLLFGGPPGQWVCATPDLEVQAVDLTEFAAGHVLPLRRAAPFPDVQGEQIYGFDPIDRDGGRAARRGGTGLRGDHGLHRGGPRL